jgi:pimeloyl-ACP methyl ester carboxylesterase
MVRSQKSDPRQHTLKHLIERDSYFVYGRLINPPSIADRHALAVAALSDRYQRSEIVDVNHLGKAGSYYGLNLPEGTYQLLVLEDKNQDGIYRETEVVGQRTLALQASSDPGKVVGSVDIRLGDSIIVQPPRLTIPAPQLPATKASLFYPRGTIRSLDDPIFTRQMATLGMYGPAAFLENAPMMFYALEEDTFYKIPVIFVHGIGGTPNEFRQVIERLDRRRYKLWFFYYPSGMDLDQLAEMFYEIFFSGKVVQRGTFDMVIVAHSMGGLVVREALNRFQGNEKETRVRLFISLASPFAGMVSAQFAVDYAPLVLPAWRDLAPTAPFIQQQFRKPLPASVEHYLIYAYGNTGQPDDSDGIVPVYSQLPASATSQISGQYGFQTTHTGILQDPASVETVIDLITQVKNIFPAEHLDYLSRGGFVVELNSSYTPLEKYMIQRMGLYLRAVANGNLKPIPFNSHFLAVVHDSEAPVNQVETAWLKFRKDYPDLATSTADGVAR